MGAEDGTDAGLNSRGLHEGVESRTDVQDEAALGV